MIALVMALAGSPSHLSTDGNIENIMGKRLVSNSPGQFRIRVWAGLLGGLVLAILAAGLWDARDPLGLGEKLANGSYTMGFRLHRRLNPDYRPKLEEVLLLYMDDESHAICWSWSFHSFCQFLENRASKQPGRAARQSFNG